MFDCDSVASVIAAGGWLEDVAEAGGLESRELQAERKNKHWIAAAKLRQRPLFLWGSYEPPSRLAQYSAAC